MEMKKSDYIQNLALALIEFQGEVINPPNTTANPFYSSRYCPLSELLNRMRPLLSKHNLAVIQSASGDGEKVSIETILIHKSGEWIEVCPLILALDKPTPQGAGSAITYGRRYALSAILGISSEDDDDANLAEKPVKGATKEATKKARPARSIVETAIFQKMWARTKEVFPKYSLEEINRIMHEHILEEYGLESSSGLKKEQIEEILAWLDGWVEKKGETEDEKVAN